MDRFIPIMDPLSESLPLYLSTSDFVKLCKSSKEFSHLCDDKETWTYFLQRDFNIIYNGPFPRRQYAKQKQLTVIHKMIHDGAFNVYWEILKFAEPGYEEETLTRIFGNFSKKELRVIREAYKFWLREITYYFNRVTEGLHPYTTEDAMHVAKIAVLEKPEYKVNGLEMSTIYDKLGSNKFRTEYFLRHVNDEPAYSFKEIINRIL